MDLTHISELIERSMNNEWDARSFPAPGNAELRCAVRMLVGVVEAQAEEIAALSELVKSNDEDLDTVYDIVQGTAFSDPVLVVIG